MEFLVFSDFHAHNFPYAASRVPVPGCAGVYNSRLRDSLLVLDEIHDYAREHGIERVLFGGDLFHVRSAVKTDVHSLVTERLVDMAEDVELYMVLGNHDMGDRRGFVHSLTGLAYVDGIEVYDQGVTIEYFRDWALIAVPYTDDIEKARSYLRRAAQLAETEEKPCVLLAHLGMQGARVGSDYVLVKDSDIQVSDIDHTKFAACFFGHYHEHQKLFPNGWFIGATHQHVWSDSGGSRGFLHVKMENGKVSFKQIETQAPKFLTIREDSDGNPEPRPQDFVRYVAKPGTKRSAVETKIRSAQLEIIEEIPKDDSSFSLEVDKLDPMAMVDAWVDAKCPEDLRPANLKELGKRYIKRVNI